MMEAFSSLPLIDTMIVVLSLIFVAVMVPVFAAAVGAAQKTWRRRPVPVAEEVVGDYELVLETFTGDLADLEEDEFHYLSGTEMAEILEAPSVLSEAEDSWPDTPPIGGVH